MRKMAVKRDKGLLSRPFKKWSANRVESFVFIIADAKINAPSIKKTALLPKRENVVFAGNTLSNGRRANMAIPVTGSGRAPVIHIVTAKKKTESAFCPCRVSPSGVLIRSRKILTANPRRKITIFIFFILFSFTRKKKDCQEILTMV